MHRLEKSCSPKVFTFMVMGSTHMSIDVAVVNMRSFAKNSHGPSAFSCNRKPSLFSNLLSFV